VSIVRRPFTACVVYTSTLAAHNARVSYSSRAIFLKQAHYNAVANEELYEAVALLTTKGRRRDAGSWFGSVQGILNHVLVADLQWLRRFRALSPESAVLSTPGLFPEDLAWGRELHEDLVEMTDTRTKVDRFIADWFAEFPADRYGDSFEYTDSGGNVRPAIAAVAFQFLFVHQIHHRGQVSQILDELGLPNNPADNLAFIAPE